MDSIFQTMNDPLFGRIFYGLGFAALVLSLGLIACAFAFYGRAQEQAIDGADAKWVLLFASWRDSLIITMLYIAESLMFDFSTLQATAQQYPDSILLYAPVIQPVVSLGLHVCIFVIAALRIIAISQWLRQMARNG